MVPQHRQSQGRPVRAVPLVRQVQPVRRVQRGRRVQPLQPVRSVHPVRQVQSLRSVQPLWPMQPVRQVRPLWPAGLGCLGWRVPWAAPWHRRVARGPLRFGSAARFHFGPRKDRADPARTGRIDSRKPRTALGQTWF